MAILKKHWLPALALTSLLLGAGRAQTPSAPTTFPFVIPWDDATPGTATDVSFLNTKPAGAHGFIVPKEGHFVESKTGTRVRFLGVNLAARAAFPGHADAEKVAARLAKYGVNIVRLHHMDNDDWGSLAHIWDDSFKDHRHISTAQLDKLDYLIAQLKRNGIYANINLHVSRQFTEADGFPPSVAKIAFGYDKRVDEFDRRMIALQKDYARRLLTHVNPYTGLSYARDPAVAVVEINNENSLVGDPWANLGGDLDTLPEPFRGELVGFWNDWLRKKYGTDATLKAAWLRGVTPPGPSLVADTSPWSIEHQGTSQATLTSMNRADAPLGLPVVAAPEAQFQVTTVDDTDWHVQAHQTGLNFQNGATYTVSFRAKADRQRKMPVAAGLDQADWHNVGLTAAADLGTDWKTFRFSFEAHDTVPEHGRVAFTLGGQTGTVWISDFQVKPGAEGAGLQPGQSLTAKTIDLPVSGTRSQKADWLLFLADTERAYAEEMRGYLKHDLNVHANVLCSQISWGGLTGVNREAQMDFADNHAYWQHPSFPHKAWDSQDWNIPNTPMVADLARGGGGTLRDLAEYRVAGKPYSVSEYNHPAPSDYQAEAVPEFTSFAAFQDWDIIYLFDYGDYGTGVDNEKIGGYFGVGPNPAKWAFMPAAALLFRAQELAPATDSDRILLSKAVSPDLLTASSAWATAGNGKPPDFLAQRLSIRPEFSPAARPVASVGMGRQHADTSVEASPLQVKMTSAGAQYIADSPGAASVVGFVGGQTVTTRAATFTFPQFGNNFAAITLTPLDAQPVARSRHLLLTLVGRVENQDMHWNATRTSVGDQWGHSPTVAEGIPATVTFPTSHPGHVYALNATGHRHQEVPVSHSIGGLALTGFTVGPQYQTVWYEIGE